MVIARDISSTLILITVGLLPMRSTTSASVTVLQVGENVLIARLNEGRYVMRQKDDLDVCQLIHKNSTMCRAVVDNEAESHLTTFASQLTVPIFQASIEQCRHHPGLLSCIVSSRQALLSFATTIEVLVSAQNQKFSPTDPFDPHILSLSATYSLQESDLYERM